MSHTNATTVPGRRNGFSAPYSWPQILAWLVLAVTILEFLFFVSPMMPLAASIPITVFFFVLIGAIIYYGGLTQAIDPMDAYLRLHLHQTQPEKEAQLSRFFYHRFNPLPTSTNLPEEESMKQCWLCEIQVAEPSLHCRYCGKCVKNFDHHCMWLNTCIGKDNYQYFFRTMLWIVVMQVVHIVLQVALLVDSWTGGATNVRANDWFNAGAASVIHGVWIFFIVFDVASLFLLGQLIWFHIMLQRQQLTTYAYIVQESAKRRDKIRKEQELSAYRTGAILKANLEGRTLDSFKLHMGRVCQLAGCDSCDPLEIPAPVVKGSAFGDDAELGMAHFGNALSSDSQQHQQSDDVESPSSLLQEKSESSAVVEGDAFVPDPGITFVKVNGTTNGSSHGGDETPISRSSSTTPPPLPRSSNGSNGSIPEQPASLSSAS